MLLIAVLQLLLLCIQDGRTWPDNYLPESTNTNLIKYFKVDTGKTSDIDVVLNVEALINELRCSNNKSVGLLEVTIKNGNLDQDEVVLYWNTKAILLKVSTYTLLNCSYYIIESVKEIEGEREMEWGGGGGRRGIEC